MSHYGTARLWHPSGVMVMLPIPCVFGEKFDYASPLEAVADAIAAGWLVEPPDAGSPTKAGEHYEAVGYVVRAAKVGVGNVIVPIIDLYRTAANESKPFLRHYLEKPSFAAAIAAFEKASGLKYESLGRYTGTGRVDRGNPLENELVTPVPKPLGVFWTLNPDYDPAETDASKKKAMRKFSRWADAEPVTTPPVKDAPKAQERPPDDDADIQRERNVADATARTRGKEAKTVDDLVAVWKDLSPDVQTRVHADFSARKTVLLAAAHRETLKAEIVAAGKVMRLSPTELILKFSIPLKLDVNRLPTWPNLTDEQLLALRRHAQHAATAN